MTAIQSVHTTATNATDTATEPTPDLVQAMRHWGPLWHRDIVAGRDAMYAAFAPHLAQAEAQAAAEGVVNLARDTPYAAHARQVLDVYAPARPQHAQAPWPVMLFVHGGAFVRGDKEHPCGIYRNVALDFARHGWLALNVEYRLAPEAPWPEGAVDVREAVLWAQTHVARFGGDAQRIFLMAHSAACAHTATAVWDERVRPTGGLPIAGMALVSPRSRADVRAENPNAFGVRAYYGDDESQYNQRAPLAHVRPDAPPTLVALAQYENPLLEFYALELAHALAQACDTQGGPMPRVLQLPDHNHTSLMAGFNLPGNLLGRQIRDWCARVERGEFRARNWGSPGGV